MKRHQVVNVLVGIVHGSFWESLSIGGGLRGHPIYGRSVWGRDSGVYRGGLFVRRVLKSKYSGRRLEDLKLGT